MSASAETGARHSTRMPATLGLDFAVVASAALVTVVWFSERLVRVPLAAPLALVAACSAVWWAGMRWPSVRLPAGATRWRSWRPRVETWVCVALAVVYRLPAIVHPWGWANTEAAYAGFPALHIRAGLRPAPVFAEGAPYMGTLKGHLTAGLAWLTGSTDHSLLLVLTSLLLYAMFIAATMSVARRIAGAGAATVAGAYLALSAPFVTVFSVNCLGQYVDLLALGGLSLALLARTLDEDLAGRSARGIYFGLGLCLGLALWQQPLAIVYVAVVLVALLLRSLRTGDPWSAYALPGIGLGVLPVLVWNWEHAGATRAVVERALTPWSDLPGVAGRFVSVALPVLMGAGKHVAPSQSGVLRATATLVALGLFAAFVVRHRRALRAALAGRPSAALLAPLLLIANSAIVLLTIRGSQYERPRYLLPIVAATAIHLGSVTQWLAARSRPAAALLVLAVLGGNVAATWPRLRGGAPQTRFYRHIIAALDERGLRTGYADFSIAHPVTLFTAERIVLSPRLGPTPAWESPRHAQRLVEQGVDVLVLRPEDDHDAFARRLQALGVGFRSARDPVPMFFDFSRRVTIEELSATAAPPTGEAGAESP